MSLLLLRSRHMTLYSSVALALIVTFIASALSPASVSLLVIGAVVLPLFTLAFLVGTNLSVARKILTIIGLILLMVLAEYLGIMIQAKPAALAGTLAQWYGTLAIYVAIALPQAILFIALTVILAARTVRPIIRTILLTLIVVLYTALLVYLLSGSNVVTTANLLLIGILYITAVLSIPRVRIVMSLTPRP